jgi:hypothetical protein
MITSPAHANTVTRSRTDALSGEKTGAARNDRASPRTLRADIPDQVGGRLSPDHALGRRRSDRIRQRLRPHVRAFRA